MGFDPTIGPRDASVAALSPAAVARLLESSGAAFATELLALGDDLARWRQGADEWCANEVAGHVIEADRRGFGGRIARILREDGVAEEGWDQLAVAAARRDVERPVADVVAELRRGREEALAIVRSLHPGDLSRRARHNRVGEVSIVELLQEWVFHDRNHLKQLLLSAQARVWPAMGNTRRFTDPDA